MINIESNRLSAISRLFSASVITELARKGKSPTFTRLVGEAQFPLRKDAYNCVRDVYDKAFAILKKKENRHEYVYKSALAQNVLLGTHSLNTASMLTEFRVGNNKADVVILNGTGTVYEIKSERDSLSRLDRQVEAYREVFASVYVIAGRNHISSVFDTVPEDVGILMLSDRQNISEVRAAKNMPERTRSEAIFDSIRISEAKAILKECGIEVPDVPNTEVHSVLRELFNQIPSELAHSEMVKTLKKSRDLSSLGGFVQKLPKSLQSAGLTTNLRKMDQQRLIDAVNTSYEEALEWI